MTRKKYHISYSNRRYKELKTPPPRVSMLGLQYTLLLRRSSETIGESDDLGLLSTNLEKSWMDLEPRLEKSMVL